MRLNQANSQDNNNVAALNNTKTPKFQIKCHDNQQHDKSQKHHNQSNAISQIETPPSTTGIKDSRLPKTNTQDVEPRDRLPQRERHGHHHTNFAHGREGNHCHCGGFGDLCLVSGPDGSICAACSTETPSYDEGSRG